MTTIGLIGAGHIGSQIARLAVAHGHKVVISNSREPESLATLVAELGPNARAATAKDAAKAGDIVVVTLPLKNYRQVPVEPLEGKIVIDTNNYYPQRDGHIPELDNESTTTAELLQAHLPTSKVVKAFNHIYAAQLTTDGRPAGTPNRRALVIAGDDPVAKRSVKSSRHPLRAAPTRNRAERSAPSSTFSAAATLPPPSVTTRTSLASSCIRALRSPDRVAATNADMSWACFASISPVRVG